MDIMDYFLSKDNGSIIENCNKKKQLLRTNMYDVIQQKTSGLSSEFHNMPKLTQVWLSYLSISRKLSGRIC
jgi:hypothetical protein